MSSATILMSTLNHHYSCGISPSYIFFFFFFVRYTGPLLDEAALSTALDDGPRSLEYTSLVSWLSSELQSFCGLQENVNPITGRVLTIYSTAHYSI